MCIYIYMYIFTLNNIYFLGTINCMSLANLPIPTNSSNLNRKIWQFHMPKIMSGRTKM